MSLPVTSIHLFVRSTDSSTAFYEALLGVRPSRREGHAVSFDVVALVLALTLEPRAATSTARPSRSSRRRGATGGSRFTLYVREPQRVGELAVALRRAGVPILLADRGLSASDPDGNRWSVVLSPSARARPIEQEPAGAERRP